MKAMTKGLALAAGVLGGVLGLGWLGLQAPPGSMSPPATGGRDLGTIPIPAGLPGPAQRYLEASTGKRVPLAESGVVWGQARMQMGLWVRGRFCAFHDPGRSFYRPLQITWCGLPLVRGVDQYVDGRGAMFISGKLMTNDAISHGANHILWVEAAFMPSVFITDTRLRWEPVDYRTCRLFVPSIEGVDTLTLHFDSRTGLLERVSTLRYRSAGRPKVPWHVDYLQWAPADGGTYPSAISVTWEDQGHPWSFWTIDGFARNVDISREMDAARAIMARG